ncbi:uncharacterized protein N0V89_001714 [Didymosphaeria variabile]|uniref:Uncharacterized protein n=1 Tax=Didymosphaeria variabile TaxID=1932322 RepID=A0A9W8XRA9_9PLEO|nr:uncharacterized protein N0V89_001714 [Didymosphaeria variabile]KAJ4357139.1 hypothetical protein N0V89_001714 [Didymosphaeria variabile]
MHAVLCISARHLAYLCPERTAYYANLASTHLHRTLSGFRSALLSVGLASKKKEDIDVFISTALLLQFELWADVSYLDNGDGDEASYKPSKDAIFAYSASLKNTLLGYFEPSDVQRSSVMTHLVNDGTLSDVIPFDPCTTIYVQNFFLRRGRVTRDMVLPSPLSPEDLAEGIRGQGEAVPTRDGAYTPIISALTPLLIYLSSSYMPLQNASMSSSMSSSMSTSTKIARHILCFPILCRGAFAGKIAASDPCALLILYHFFRAARMLLDGDEFWWAKRRAAAVERGLGKWLGRDYGEE